MKIQQPQVPPVEGRKTLASQYRSRDQPAVRPAQNEGLLHINYRTQTYVHRENIYIYISTQQILSRKPNRAEPSQSIRHETIFPPRTKPTQHGGHSRQTDGDLRPSHPYLVAGLKLPSAMADRDSFDRKARLGGFLRCPPLPPIPSPPSPPPPAPPSPAAPASAASPPPLPLLPPTSTLGGRLEGHEVVEEEAVVVATVEAMPAPAAAKAGGASAVEVSAAEASVTTADAEALEAKNKSTPSPWTAAAPPLPLPLPGAMSDAQGARASEEAGATADAKGADWPSARSPWLVCSCVDVGDGDGVLRRRRRQRRRRRRRRRLHAERCAARRQAGQRGNNSDITMLYKIEDDPGGRRHRAMHVAPGCHLRARHRRRRHKHTRAQRTLP